MLVFQGVRRAVESLSFHPDGTHLVAAGGNSDRVECWSVTARAKLREWPGPYGTNQQVRFHPSGNWCACTAYAPTVSGGDFVVIDASSWAAAAASIQANATHIAFAPGGDRLVIHDYQYHERLVCRRTSAAGVGPLEWVTLLDVPAPVRGWSVYGLDFFPAGDRFVTVEVWPPGEPDEQTSVVRIRSAADGGIVQEVGCPVGFDVRVSPDGEWVALRVLHELHLIPTRDPAAQLRVRNPSRKHITGLAFHPSGRYLAVTSNDCAVRLHDRDAGWAMCRAYDWNVGKLKSVAFSADGALAAAGGDKGAVVVWDADL